MTRGAFLKKYFWRMAVSVALAGLLIYIVYHVFFASSKSPNTTPVRSITDYQILGGEAYLFREESVLTSASQGVISTLAESGEKVSRGVILAEVWNGYSADRLESAQKELDRLDRIISVLEEIEATEGLPLTQAEQHRTDAMSDYLEIRRSVIAGDWSRLGELEEEMLSSLTRYTSLAGDREALQEALTNAKQERTALLVGERSLLTNERASGYFYDRTYVDGYEGIFVPSALTELTAQGLTALINTPASVPAGLAVGKIVYGNTWYVAIPFEGDVSSFFKEGNSYSVTFPDNRDRTLRMRCERMNATLDGATVAVFSSDDVPPDFTFFRSQRIEITVDSCQGYYVPESALCAVEGVEGVYIFRDSTAYFRYIEVIYRGDGYVIAAEQGDRGDAYLALHDMMITSGQNLYHGKVFR